MDNLPQRPGVTEKLRIMMKFPIKLRVSVPPWQTAI